MLIHCIVLINLSSPRRRIYIPNEEEYIYKSQYFNSDNVVNQSSNKIGKKNVSIKHYVHVYICISINIVSNENRMYLLVTHRYHKL